MTNFMKAILCSAAAFAIVAYLPAQDKGKAGAKSGILQPQMTVGPDGGTYAAPMGKIGDKADQPWSATTVGASVDGKPNAGAVKTVVGEIVDFSCYLEVGKHGEKHRDCAQKCFRSGCRHCVRQLARVLIGDLIMPIKWARRKRPIDANDKMETHALPRFQCYEACMPNCRKPYQEIRIWLIVQ